MTENKGITQNTCYHFGFLNTKNMNDFKKFRRTQIAEMRPVTQEDIESRKEGDFYLMSDGATVSISTVDVQNGSPKLGDMIARNPKNHLDQWLVAEDYFKDNFECIEDWKEIILEAYKQGKTIQSGGEGDWEDFVPQNQLDRPNVDYGGENYWRIKP